jgi:hypothetical protein
MKRHNWSEREEEILKEKITSGLTPSKIVREPEFADIGIGSIRSKYQRFKELGSLEILPMWKRQALQTKVGLI